jgi:hypothetical protein
MFSDSKDAKKKQGTGHGISRVYLVRIL